MSIELTDYLDARPEDESIDLSLMADQLEAFKLELESAVDVAEEAGFDIDVENHDDWGDYAAAYAFCKEARNYGERAINDTHMTDYARDYAEEQGLIVDKWPGNCIDWEEAADQLLAGMTAVEWMGEYFFIN